LQLLNLTASCPFSQAADVAQATDGAKMSDRDDWTNEILDFLSWRGKVIFSDTWTPATIPELTHAIAARDWETVLLANLLASPKFVREIRELTRLAPREMEQQRNDSIGIVRGRIKGKILARRTLTERVRRADSTIWVTKSTSKEWQTEPNRAAAGFLVHLSNAATLILEALGQSEMPVVVDGLAAIELALRSQPLRYVEPDPQWHLCAIPSTLTTKSRFYRLVAEWIETVKSARRTRDTTAIRSALLGGWLRAEEDDRLLELFALSQVIRTLHAQSPWDEFKLDVGKSKGLGSLRVSARRGDLRVSVRFDASPGVAGKYAWILNRYSGIDGRGRRPDLTVTTELSGAVRTTLIEAKATNPNSQYGRDSVVKVLGYLKDFEELWSDEVACTYPRCILLYSRGVQPTVSRPVRFALDDVVLSDPGAFKEDLVELFERHSHT
jgi:hypothetical protein